jgi:hypothetical protein
VFDTSTSTTTLIDPHPGDLRFDSALGNNTLAYVDFLTGTRLGDIFAVALPSGLPLPVSTSSLQEQTQTYRRTVPQSFGSSVQPQTTAT